MSDDPDTATISSLVYRALHDYYDATSDYSSQLVINTSMNPNIINIEDFKHNRRYTVTIFGENTHY